MAEIVDLVPIVAAPQHQGFFTLEMFIKNGVNAVKGTIEFGNAEAVTQNILKTFVPIEVLENHWVSLASYNVI